MELVTINNNEITINQNFINEYKEFKKLQLKMDLAEKELGQVVEIEKKPKEELLNKLDEFLKIKEEI